MKAALIFRKVVHYFNLEAELDDYERIHESIVKDSIFKGTNLWILVFAIVVASVGLNMNSTAVIIGAMLISPLMGPINGMGYSIATYNFALFQKAFKNFSFAVVASLLASTTYFALSPVSTAHSELLARTSPTIYDVLIALFGGLAGIVAISSRQKGNVIPGVAIATALMPPLCTAGYGLATAQLHFFLGAIYLFTINTVFIALASVAISQILKFPISTIVDTAQKRRVNRWISVVIAIVLLPSIYFGYGLVQQERFTENANRYIANVSMVEGNYLLRSSIDASQQAIRLVYGGVNLTDKQKEQIIQKADNFGLNSSSITIKQGLVLNGNNGNNAEAYALRQELVTLSTALKKKQVQVDSLSRVGYLGKTLLREVASLYPQITGCAYAETFQFQKSAAPPGKIPVVIFTAIGKGLSNPDKGRIESWVKARLNNDSAKVLFE